MTLARRLAKLERAAGKGARCARCRLTLHDTPPDPWRLVDRSQLVRCEFCGTEYRRGDGNSGLGDLTDRVGALYVTFAPDDFYTDARALASRLWFHNWPYRVLSDGARGVKGERYRRLMKLIKGSRRRAVESRGLRADGTRVDRETAKARERRARVAAERAALERRARRARRERFGRRFPELDRLKARLTAKVETWRPADARFSPRVEVSRLIAFAKLEKVIFGEVQPETAEALAHWRAAWRAAKPAKLKARRDELWLEGVNREREAAGLREFYSLSDAERTLESEREAAAPTPVPAQVTGAAVGGELHVEGTGEDFWNRPLEPGGVEFIGGDLGAGRPTPTAGLEGVLEQWRPVDPTSGMRLVNDSTTGGDQGKPYRLFRRYKPR